MKLKLLIALVAVPTLVMAQANLPSSASVGSTGKSGGGVPTPPIYTSPNTATGSSTTPSNPNLSTTGYRPPIIIGSDLPTGVPANQQMPNNNATGSSSGNKETNVGGIYVDFDSSGKTTSKK